jgi:hypothetical protein
MKTYLEFMDEVEDIGICIIKRQCEIQMHSPLGNKTDLVLVTQLNATCPTLRHQEEAEYEAIKWAIDFDKWQHSWHTEVKPENYKYFLEIIQGKVIEKSEVLVKLNTVAIFLSNRISQIEQESPELLEKKVDFNDSDYLPF